MVFQWLFVMAVLFVVVIAFEYQKLNTVSSTLPNKL